MKNYIKKNLEPILVGVCVSIFSIYIINTISDVITKIAILMNK